MKKLILLTVILLNYLQIFGQTIINSTLTPNHQEVRGSKVSMIPPQGFVVATTFLGFQEAKTKSSILVLDVPKSFTEISSGLTIESLFKQGVRVEQSVEITLNGVPALFIKGEQTVAEILFRKYILVLGTNKETLIINAIAPISDLTLDEMIKNAILSTIYDTTKVLSPLDSVDFQINTLSTNYVFAKLMPNMLIYNVDGKMPSESKDKESFVVAKVFSKAPITDTKAFAINRIKTLPVQIQKMYSVLPIQINGLNGFEIYAEGVNRKTGVKEQAYQVLLYANDSYYILFGSAQNNFKNNLAVFKKLAKSFILK